MRRAAAFISVLAVSLSAAADSNLVEDAAREAALRCQQVSAESIDRCSTINGRSKEHSAARHAVIRLYETRNRFVSDCNKSATLIRCQEDVNWLIGAGITSAASMR